MELGATVKILTTTTNLESITKYIGGELISVKSLTKGTQDPHFVEAKPSFMLKASRADLMISIGFDLEVGWLPLIIRGSRNPKLNRGNKGSLIAGNSINAIEKPQGALTRSDGDIHPDGNPHFLLDPLNTIIVAGEIKTKLSEIDAQNKETYEKNFQNFRLKMETSLKKWSAQIPKDLKVITYHRTLSYFYKRFGIENTNYLEPKPGIPPSASHILKVIKEAKENKTKLILIENYFDPSIAKRIINETEGIEMKIIPVAVNGEKGINNIFQLFDRLVESVRK